MVQLEMSSLYRAEKYSATPNQKLSLSSWDPASWLQHARVIPSRNCPGMMGLTLPARLPSRRLALWPIKTQAYRPLPKDSLP
ncbi:MAG TPA: hypothetical protein VE616_17175, partial [Candidatus Udaeobacter sp.]|nr:hypothetical protein [Candidatus Udaeobacter sp.]